jgi:hypothetical protein
VNKKIFGFLLFIVSVLGSMINAQDYVGIGKSYDPEGGKTILIQDISASSYLCGDGKNEYIPKKAFDSKYDTAWCEGVKGSGLSEWIKFDFAESDSFGSTINVYRILIINGLAASKELYFANNRVKKLEVEFSEGEKRVIELRDGVLDYQSFVFHIKAKWAKLTILEVYKGTKYDDTCISEIDFETVIHPCDLTPREREMIIINKADADYRYDFSKCKK